MALNVVGTQQWLEIVVCDSDGEGDIEEQEARERADKHLGSVVADVKEWLFSHIIWHNYNRMTVVYERL